jgi:acetyl esterase/lipase
MKITEHSIWSIVKIILWLLAALGLFLSLWVVITAPIFSLLTLSVGAPEISPLIILINLLALGLSGLIYTRHYPKKQPIIAIVIGSIVLALGLSGLPLLQFSATQQQAESAMMTSLGKDYLERIPLSIKSQMRSQPFVLNDFWQGISSPKIRIDRHIRFAAADGTTQLAMNIYRPARVGKYPAIVSIYGGAWQRGSADSDENFNRYIAARGYVVWAIDYRHAPQYKFPTQIDDVVAAFEFIQQQAATKETDLDRVAIIGRSAGAQLAMLGAYRQGLPIRAVVNYYGPVNLTAGYNNPPVPDPIDSRATLRDFLGGTPQDFPQLYRDASPLLAVKSDLPPTLLIYGGKDRIVEAKYGKYLADTLAKFGNRSIFIEIPWADHAFDAVFAGISNQLALYYTERFLAYFLL